MVTRIVAISLFLLTLPQVGWAAECASFAPSEGADPASPEFASELSTLGTGARAAGCFEQADRLFEGAYRADPQARYIYERILTREKMGDHAYAFELLDGYRAELVADPSLEDLVELDSRLRSALRTSKREPITAPPVLVAPQKRSALDTVGPIALGILSATSLGLAAYGMSAKCKRTASDGTCLEGSEVAVGPTAAYAVAGVLGLVGAAVWWIAAIPKTDAQTVHLTTEGFVFVF